MTGIQTRAAFAWGALIFLVSVLYWGLIAEDLQRIDEMEYSYKRKQALLYRLQALPNEEAAIRRQLEQLSAEASARFLYEGDENAVRSLIQRDIRQLASGEDIRIASMRTLGQPRQQGLLARSSVQLNLTTTHEKLVSFLQKTEAWEPLLRIGRISVRVRQPSTDSTAAELSVLIEVTGFRRLQGRESTE